MRGIPACWPPSLGSTLLRKAPALPPETAGLAGAGARLPLPRIQAPHCLPLAWEEIQIQRPSAASTERVSLSRDGNAQPRSSRVPAVLHTLKTVSRLTSLEPHRTHVTWKGRCQSHHPTDEGTETLGCSFCSAVPSSLSLVHVGVSLWLPCNRGAVQKREGSTDLGWNFSSTTH